MGSPDSGTSTFVKGSLVEASSKMDGLRGAWFVGKILEIPLSRRRRSTRTMTFFVEFQSLLSNDGKELLREHVCFPFLRPLPPPPPHEHEEFQVSEVVDAYHNDGWWVGVVCQVWEEEEAKAYSVLFDNPPDLIKFPSSQVRVHLDWLDGKWVKPPSKKMRLKVAGTSSSKRKRGERPKSLFEVKKCDGTEGGVDKTIIEDYTTSGVELAIFGEPTEKVVERIDSSSKTKDIGMAIVPINMVDVNEPISICPATTVADSIVCDKTVNQSSEGKGRLQQDIVEQCDAMTAAIDDTPCKNQSFRFFESSLSLLNFIQSMKVFRLMPQTPHFRPLNECNEILREGLAIGQWMTFVKVAEQISQLQVDASSSTFSSIFECLLELESNGFDVKAMRSRLLELQSMKENQELQTKLEKLKCEIVERNRKETKMKTGLDDAMNELKMLEAKIKVVQEKKTRLVCMMEDKDSQITKLRSIDDVVNEKDSAS